MGWITPILDLFRPPTHDGEIVTCHSTPGAGRFLDTPCSLPFTPPSLPSLFHEPGCRCSTCALLPPQLPVSLPAFADAAVSRAADPIRTDARVFDSLCSHTAVGQQFPRSAFSGSPQESAILNLHLREYFAAHNRSQREMPYAVLPTQYALLDAAGLEHPVEGAPTVPHGFHKNLEERQLRQIGSVLVAGKFGLISVKTAKHHLLPVPAHVQNPIMESRDVGRYPESGIAQSTFAHDGVSVFLLHDVSSVVTVHELVERLVRENPSAHLFVTGVNPAEALEHVVSFHPNSHRIVYDDAQDRMHWMPHGSESEGYTQPISVTKSWLMTGAVRASNGVLYQVVLREYVYGHCTWHVFPGEELSEPTRSFPTGTLMCVPARYTGTFKDEWMNRDFVSKMLSFGERTTVRLQTNYLAKANGLRASNGAFISASDCHVGANLCRAFDPERSRWAWLLRGLYLAACVATLRFDAVFRTTPDIYVLIDERHPAMVVHPTTGGGWSRSYGALILESIPNSPTLLEQVSVVTALASVILLPKMAIGAALVQFWGTDWVAAARCVWDALEITPARAMLTTTALVLAAALPSRATAFLCELGGHFSRQLWLPGRVAYWFGRVVIEVTGAPGHVVMATHPGRGWLWQIGIWLTFLHEIFPPFMSNSVTLFGQHSAFAHSPAVMLHYAAGATLFWYAFAATPIVCYLWVRFSRFRSDLVPSAVRLCRLNSRAFDYPVARAATARLRSTAAASLFAPSAWAYAQLLGLVIVTSAAYTLEAMTGKFVDGIRGGIESALLTGSYCAKSAEVGAWLCASGPGRGTVRSRLPIAVSILTNPIAASPPNAPVAPTVVQLRLPVGGPRGLGYVSPAGMEFREWYIAVQAAYGLAGAQYPALAANSHCFYTSVSELVGGDAHMWYSWFLAAENVLPGNARAPFGEATIAEMNRFCATAGFAYDIDGVVTMSAPGTAGWPTLHLTLTRNEDHTLHCEPRNVAPLSPTVQALAVALASVARSARDWLTVEINRSTVAAGGLRQASPFLRGIFPTLVFEPFDVLQWNAALTASGTVRAILPTQRDLHWDFGRFPPNMRPAGQPNTWPSTFDVASPLAGEPVRGRGTGTGSLWSPPSGTMGGFCLPKRRLQADRPEPFIAGAGPIAATGVGALVDVPVGRKPRLKGDDVRTYRDATGTKVPKRGLVDDITPVRGPQPVAPMYSRVHELRTALESELGTDLGCLPPISLEPEEITWTPDAARASRLADDLQEHPELLGPAGRVETARALACITDYVLKTATADAIKVTMLFGCAGSGKSTATVQLLRSMSPDERRAARIVTHTAQLRGDTKALFTRLFPEMRGFNFPTLPNIIAQPSGGVVVFDDAGKFWGGIVDLVAITNPGVRHIIVNGDPAQGRSTIPIAGALSERLPTMAEEFASLATKYATMSYRMPRLIADTLGLFTTSAELGHITYVTGPTGHLVVTSSPRYVQVLKGGGRTAVTFMDVQGEEFGEPIELDITGLETAITDSVAYVGLTRSRMGVFVHGEAVSPSRALVTPTGSALLNAILYDMRLANSPNYRPDDGLARRCFSAHLMRAMPNLPWFGRVGYVPYFDDFQLHTHAAHFDAIADTRVSEAVISEPVAAEFAPLDTFDPEVAPADKFSRERAARGDITNQFTETATVNPARHLRTDTSTYQLSLDKRLKRATPEENRARMAACAREDMIAMFDILVPNPPDWTTCGDEHRDSAPIEYTETRTRDAVEEKLRRHDPDRTGADVVISLKAQTIKKVEKLGCSAVGGQLIHEYDIAQTLADAPYFRFLEERLLPRFPRNIHFYHRESVPEHIQRMRPELTLGRGFSGSDVTGWDAGCDAGMLNFDRHVLKACNMPEDFIAGYCERRLATSSQHGPMRTMQNSGDRGTWLFNSTRRAVVSCITMRLEPQFHSYSRTAPGRAYLQTFVPDYRSPAAGYVETLDVNGDDILLDVAKQATPFPDSDWVFKDQVGDHMEFSGMDFRSDGRVTFSPFGLYYRCLIKEEGNTTDPVQWRAYADLFSQVDSTSPYAMEVARLLLKHLTPGEVIDAAHESLSDAVARVATSPDAAAWREFSNVRHPPARVVTHR